MARIRTIKPEFWQSEAMSRVSEFARLLAIALLNHADDEGYFKANEYLVRAACFPFEESSAKVRGAIQELSAISYIDVREASDGQLIGKVCKFSDHQRIDRPRSSALVSLFANASEGNRENPSENGEEDFILGSVDEASTTHPVRKGKEREQGKEGEQGISRLSANDSPTVNPDEVFDYFVASDATTKPEKLTPERRKKLTTRLRVADWPWKASIDKLPIPNTEKFTFQPTFDWLIANDGNARKVAEGQYDARHTAKPVSSGTRFDPQAKEFGDGF